MNRHLFYICALGFTLGLAVMPAQAVTINLAVGVVRDNAGNPMADGGLLMLVSAGPNGSFGNPTVTSWSDDPDDIIIPAEPYGGTFAMDSGTAFVDPNSGIHIQSVRFNIGELGLLSGQKLRLVWFPGLAVTATQPGSGRFYGHYTDPVGIDNSEPWVVPNSNAATIDFNMLTLANGGSVPETAAYAIHRTAGENQPPVAVCRPTLTVTTSGADCLATVTGADVDGGSFDPDGPIVSRTISPPGPFPVGEFSVTLTVTDDSGQTDRCTTVLTITDPPPSLVCPANITRVINPPAESAVINFTAAATDNCEGVVVVCLPPSGSTFDLGVTTVTCVATDSAGATANCSFSVNITQGDAPPEVFCRDVFVDANNMCGAVVTPEDVDDGSFDEVGWITSMTLVPAGPYPLGETVVTLIVENDRGATDTCTATITVRDVSPPVMECPLDIVAILASGQNTVTVAYPAPVAMDNCSTVSVLCSPPSGATFLQGSTVVTCNGTDLAGNVGTCSFVVTVRGALGGCVEVQDLINAVNQLPVSAKTKRSLRSFLSSARQAEQSGNEPALRQSLRSFIHEMRRLRRVDVVENTIVRPIVTCAKILVAESIIREWKQEGR